MFSPGQRQSYLCGDIAASQAVAWKKQLFEELSKLKHLLEELMPKRDNYSSCGWVFLYEMHSGSAMRS